MIHHVYSEHSPADPKAQRRMKLAKRSWSIQPWEEIPVEDHEVRLYRDAGGNLPYVKDLLNRAIQNKANDQIIVFTNADICVAQACSHRLVSALQATAAVYCFRRDFSYLDTLLPDPMIANGHLYCGADLFAFRVSWWNAFNQYFPDMILGREAWDAIFRILIEKSLPNKQSAIPNLVYHEWHPSTWEAPRNRRTLSGQQHNLHLARLWMLNSGLNPAIIGI